jgi:hypothetical protein
VKVLHCSHCRQVVFFENTQCVNCGYKLCFVPDLNAMAAVEADSGDLWRMVDGSREPRRFRLCQNYLQENICNWAVTAEDSEPLCESCRLTQVIPNLGINGNHEAWFKLEAAKRRLIYSLRHLHCPIHDREIDPEHGLSYEFLSDTDPKKPVLTGHAHGVITVNIVEADDAERESRRVKMGEPYRTLLGHFRHEIGHYYWERLIRDSPRIDQFRELFGDERADYAASLKAHYEQGPPADWAEHFVSAYATSHPWEDWAESWAHYLHMSDMLETAADSGLSLVPPRRGEPTLLHAPSGTEQPFDQLIANWFPLTYILNNLNRSMGLPDGYPFVLPTPAIAKLRFVHDTIVAAAA